MKGFFSNLPKIETNRLILRKFEDTDAEDMYEYSSNENISKYVLWKRHENIEVSKEFIKYILSNYSRGELPAPWAIVYKENGKVIGTIEFVEYNIEDKYAEIGYAISEDYWGQGITVEAAKELLDIGFNILDLNRIQARCMIENVQSAKVMSKMGMIYEGTLRKYNIIKGSFKDIKMYSILKEEWLNL